MAHEPVVAVVVVTHDDAHRLPRAVESVVHQSLQDIEILIVDDASTDRTPQVASRLAGADSRVGYLRLATNSGSAGRPRNVGIAATHAPYVMFLDSDDVLTEDACEALLHAARETDAELASGLCVRVHVPDHHTETPWYPRLYRAPVTYDDVEERPGLLFDTNSTNKIYRRSFLDRTGLRYPEGRQYEDLLFSTQAYCLARRITLVPDRVYDWYVDEGAPRLSVTNRRADLVNLEHRFSIHRDIDAFLCEQGRTKLKVHKDVKFLQHDLRLYLGDLPQRDRDYGCRFMALAGHYLATVSPEALAQAGTMLRVAAHLIRADDAEGVLSVSAFLGARPRVTVDLVRDDGRVLWGDRHLDTAAGRRALDVTDLRLQERPLSRLPLQTRLRAFSIDGRVLTLRAVTRNQLGRLSAESSELALTLTARGTRRRCVLPLSSVCCRGREIEWNATVCLDDVVGTVEPGERVWDLALRTRVGDQTAAWAIEVGELALSGLAPVRVTRRLRDGDALAPYATLNGNLALRLVATRPLSRLVSGLARRARTLTRK